MVRGDGFHLEHVSEFKYLGCVLNESSTDRSEYSRKVASGRVADGIRSLVNARVYSLSVLGLHETLLLSVLMLDSETML